MGAEKKNTRAHTREGLEKLQCMHVSILFQGFTKESKLKKQEMNCHMKNFKREETYLQHKVFPKNMLHIVQSRCYSIGIPRFGEGNRQIK